MIAGIKSMCHNAQPMFYDLKLNHKLGQISVDLRLVRCQTLAPQEFCFPSRDGAIQKRNKIAGNRLLLNAILCAFLILQ